MIKNHLLFCFVLMSKIISGQSFLNGDFEINSAGVDQINITNLQYNTIMSNSIAFGSYGGGGQAGGNMDIISSNTYCGLAQHGNWYVALTGGGSDAISLKLSNPLVAGQTYTISFYDRYCSPPATLVNPFQIGLSTVSSAFGSAVYTAPNASGSWSLRTFSFVAPNNGQFITIQITAGWVTDTWCQIDNFSFGGCPLNINLGNDTSLCQGDTLTLNATTPGATYLWEDNSTNATHIITQQGIYWVDVTANNCSKRDTVNVNYPLQSVEFNNDTTLCQGEVLLLDVTTSTASYLWQDGSLNSQFNVIQPGIYWVKVEINNCSIQDTITVNYNALQRVNMGKDTALCSGNTLILNAAAFNASYLWQDNSINSELSVNQSGTYWVEISSNGCSFSDSILIEFYDCGIEMPNMFSPNGDASNDHLYPLKYSGVKEATLIIYNRWGQKLVSTNDILKGWDGYYNGAACTEGTYFWVITYSSVFNASNVLKGFVELIK